MNENLNVYEIVSKMLKKSGDSVVWNLFKGAQAIYTSHFLFIVMSVLLVFWLLTKIGEWDKKRDTYFLFVSVSTFVFVEAVMQNKDLYFWMLKIFDFPKLIAQAGVQMAFGNMSNLGVKEIGDTDPLKTVSAIQNSLTSIDIDVGSFVSGYNVPNILMYSILWLSAWGLIVCMTLMIVFSTFLAGIIQALCAFVLPFVLWNRTRGVFFAWAKVYISLSLYAPFAIFCSIVAKSSSDYAVSLSADSYSGMAKFISMVAVAVINVIAIFTLIKIPSWVNQIVGSSNDSDSMGVGSGLKIATEGIGALVRGGVQGGASGGLGSRIGGIAGGFMGGGIGARIGGEIGGIAQRGISKGVGAGMNAVRNMRNSSTIAK